MFLVALGNMFKVNIKVFQSDCHKSWITDLSDKQKSYNTTLYFARGLSLHGDAIIPKSLTASQRLSNEVHSSSVFLFYSYLSFKMFLFHSYSCRVNQSIKVFLSKTITITHIRALPNSKE